MEAYRVGYGSRVTKKCCVVMDTNMLLLLAEGINVFEQIDDLLLTKCEYIISSMVLKELEKIIHGKRDIERRKALFVLSTLKRLRDRYNIKIIEVDNYGYTVDDMLIDLALTMGCYIASNDKALRLKARRRNVPEIYYREEKGMLETSKDFI